MNLRKRQKVFLKRLELFMNTLSASAFSGAIALLYRDGRIDYTYWGISMYLLVSALLGYAIMTWLLMDQADIVEDSKSDDDSG